MQECKEFICTKKGTCIYESNSCKETCLIALDIYNCKGCVLHKACSIERKQIKESPLGGFGGT